MDVQLSADQKAFVREALQLWEDRERRRLRILAAVDTAEASLSSGKGRMISALEEARQLAEDVKRRGMARLSAEQNSNRG